MPPALRSTSGPRSNHQQPRPRPRPRPRTAARGRRPFTRRRHCAAVDDDAHPNSKRARCPRPLFGDRARSLGCLPTPEGSVGWGVDDPRARRKGTTRGPESRSRAVNAAGGGCPLPCARPRGLVPTIQPTTHNPQLTTHNPQPRPTTHDPRPTTHDPRPTTHNPQPTTHDPQPRNRARVSPPMQPAPPRARHESDKASPEMPRSWATPRSTGRSRSTSRSAASARAPTTPRASRCHP